LNLNTAQNGGIFIACLAHQGYTFRRFALAGGKGASLRALPAEPVHGASQAAACAGLASGGVASE